jgi:hypothetical protein
MPQWESHGCTLLDDEDASTIEMKVNFVRPVKEAFITTEVSVIERGLRVCFSKCTISNQKGKGVATALCTCTFGSESGRKNLGQRGKYTPTSKWCNAHGNPLLPNSGTTDLYRFSCLPECIHLEERHRSSGKVLGKWRVE